MSKGMIKLFGTTLVTAFAVAMAFPAAAHHSFAVYDMTQTQSGEGTIKEFHFGAPHSTVRFVVKGPSGKPQDLTLIGAAPSALSKAGFKPQDFTKGTKVKISWHPVRNGAPEGAMLSITLPDGRVFVDHETSAATSRNSSAGAGGPPGGTSAGAAGAAGAAAASGAAGPQ